MTLLAAHKMDTVGNKAAARDIAMIKVIAPKMAENVLDRAIQGKCLILTILLRELSPWWWWYVPGFPNGRYDDLGSCTSPCRWPG